MPNQPAQTVYRPTAAEQQEWAELAILAKAGHPREYIERYFVIEPEAGFAGGAPLVPMRFSAEPNQEYYYATLFSKELRAWPLVDALCLKDRKARWSSFVTAILSAKMFVCPGTHVLAVVNAEDTFDVLSKFIDAFYDNLPPWEPCRPRRAPSWGKERKVVEFDVPGVGKVTSTFTIRTAGSENVGTGVTPTDVVFDEYGKFPLSFSQGAQASIRASMSAGCSFWRGGTVGPDGPVGPMYQEIQQHKNGQRQFDYLFREWFKNPANALPPGNRLRRPMDREDAHIEPGVNAGPLGDQEPGLVRRFPEDGVPWQWRLARRRSWIQEAVTAAGTEERDAISVLFAREHCEDDETPWLIAGRLQFSQSLMEAQIGVANDPANARPVLNEDVRGLHLWTWRPYNPAHLYCGLMDLGSGTGGDDTSMQIYDWSAALFMGELHGNLTDVNNAVAAAVDVLRRFGSGPFALEVNRFPSVGRHVYRDLDYRNLIKTPLRPDESMDAYRRRDHGIQVTAHHYSEREISAEELNARFKSDFNGGEFRVANPRLLKTMREWDPNRQKHTPDRLAGARLRPYVLELAAQLAPASGGIERRRSASGPMWRAGGRIPLPFRVA